MSVIPGPQGNAYTAKDSDEPSTADWLGDAHFRVIGGPRPAVRRDNDPNPDDEELHPTPPDVSFMLEFDPLDVDWNADDPFPEDKELDGANLTTVA